MNLKQATKRIEELERKVKELEARRIVEQHNHYHFASPSYQPYYTPFQPYPYVPSWISTTGTTSTAGAHGVQAADLIGSSHAQ